MRIDIGDQRSGDLRIQQTEESFVDANGVWHLIVYCDVCRAEASSGGASEEVCAQLLIQQGWQRELHGKLRLQSWRCLEHARGIVH